MPKKNYIMIIVIVIVLIIGLTSCVNDNYNTNIDDKSTESKGDDGSVNEVLIEPENDNEDNLFMYPTDDRHDLLKGFFLAYYNGVLEDEKYNVYYEKNEDTYLIIKLCGYEYSLHQERMDVQYADVDISIVESEKVTTTPLN